jgi:putative thioredoxin
VKSQWVVDVAEADFQREVVERSRQVPVVVDFWAPWCGPCRMLGPLLERLAEERAGAFVLAKVNTEAAPRLAYEFGIDAIPAVKAFRDGRVVLSFTGLLPEPQLREFLDRICPSESDRLATQAAAAEVKQPEDAERIFRRVLDKEPNHTGALVGLARIMLARGRDDEAEELLGRAGLGADHQEEIDKLTAILVLRRLASEFGTEEAAHQRLAREPENAAYLYQLGVVLAATGRHNDALKLLLLAGEKNPKLATKVKEAMVQVFQAIGVRNPLADEYRAKLSRLLY